MGFLNKKLWKEMPLPNKKEWEARRGSRVRKRHSEKREWEKEARLPLGRGGGQEVEGARVGEGVYSQTHTHYCEFWCCLILLNLTDQQNFL